MHTPWFAHEYLMDDETVSDNLRGMARVYAEESYYPEKHERVIRL